MSPNSSTNRGISLPKSKDEIVRLLQLIPHPEGGYFRETWRSGVTPMESRGQTDTEGVARPLHDLVTTNRRHRPNDDGRRHGLTSIFWVPTLESPRLLLAVNESDHVHYYQGGLPFEYFLYQPATSATAHSSKQEGEMTLTRVVLGPNLLEGHQLQVAVAGGTWKCGHILQEQSPQATSQADDGRGVDYTIIGEAVGPGFDFYDFAWITLEQIEGEATNMDVATQQLFKEFCHPLNQSNTLDDIDAHYDADAH